MQEPKNTYIYILYNEFMRTSHRKRELSTEWKQFNITRTLFSLTAERK